MVRRLLRYLALRHNKAVGPYRRLCGPSGKEWAEYLRRHGNLYHLGTGCSILATSLIITPEYTWIGDRVCLGTCTLICHDGSIEVLYNRYGLRVDRLRPVRLENDVFVGHNAIVLGGSTIGEGSIVGAGSVVRQSIPPGSVVSGNPAKVVGRVKDLTRIWQAESMLLPWASLIASRDGVFDPAMEPELRRMRQEFFFKRSRLK